jgi:hypothetical protein
VVYARVVIIITIIITTAQCGEGAGEGRKLLVCGTCSAVRYCNQVTNIML